MSNALNHHLETTHGVGAGVLARLRGWVEARCQFRAVTPAPAALHRDAVPSVADMPSAQVLPFPIHGEALLVRMAECLRQRVGDRRWAEDPLVLTVSRRPHSRLSIDRSTYVDFDPGHQLYRLVLDVAPGTTFTVETSDFDTVVSIVAPYITDRLSDATPLEAAS